MSTIHLGRGSVVVEWPTDELRKGLSRFKHNKDGSGEYEELYTISERHHTLVTLPGFAERVVRLCPSHRVKDERMPMPEPDMERSLRLLHPGWHEAATKAILAGGGMVSVPAIMGSAMTAAILRAFPRDGLLDRGTPISIVAERDTATARRVAQALRNLVPGREIGVGPSTDCDDIIVVSYDGLTQVPRHIAGVFIGEDVSVDADSPRRAESISGFRNAARWGICSTAAGGGIDVDMSAEGLFGPLSAYATYADAVKAGIGVPITVCWLPCPRPDGPLVSAGEEKLVDMATRLNPRFMQMVSEIIRETPGDVGCLMTGSADMVKAMAKLVDVPQVHKKVPYKDRNVILEDISIGSIRKALLAEWYLPDSASHVMVATRAAATVDWFPWRELKRQGDKAYIVDFHHKWDVHNGRPGRLARNDEARTRRYAEYGFGQIQLDDAAQLPFV